MGGKSVEICHSLLLQKHLFQPPCDGTRDRRIDLSGSEMRAISSEYSTSWKMRRTPSGTVLAMVSAKSCSPAARAVFPAGQSEGNKG
jgi:hypothetical protein